MPTVYILKDVKDGLPTKDKTVPFINKDGDIVIDIINNPFYVNLDEYTHYLVPVTGRIVLTREIAEQIWDAALDNFRVYNKEQFIDNLLKEVK